MEEEKDKKNPYSIPKERRLELLEQGRKIRERVKQRLRPLLDVDPDKMNRKIKE